jgi:hypothetical protein
MANISGSNFKVKVKIFGTNRKNTHMKDLSLVIQKIWPMIKFLKSGSNFKVKVTRLKKKIGTNRKVLSYGIHI